MKKVMLFLGLVLLSLSLIGCSEAYEPGEDLSPDNESSQVLTASMRKIIYRVDIGIKAKQLLPLYDELLGLLNPDEWIESQQVGTQSGQLVLRIKTERLQTFISGLRSSYEVTYFNTSSRDVSVNYYNNQANIEAYEAEQARLIELFETASISEQILINQRLSIIEAELRSLTSDTNEIDGLIEYSVVNIYLNATAPYQALNFGQKVNRAFIGGIDAFVMVIETLFLAFLSLLPFLVVIVPSVFGILYINKRNYQKRLARRQQARNR